MLAISTLGNLRPQRSEVTMQANKLQPGDVLRAKTAFRIGKAGVQTGDICTMITREPDGVVFRNRRTRTVAGLVFDGVTRCFDYIGFDGPEPLITA